MHARILCFLCASEMQTEKQSVSQSVQCQFDCKIVLNCGHYTRDELQEEEKTVFNLAFSTVGLDLVDHRLHHCRMVARVNAQLVPWQLRMGLKSHCFARIICHNVLKHLSLREEAAILAVTLEP